MIGFFGMDIDDVCAKDRFKQIKIIKANSDIDILGDILCF